ncbi:hypothetical protein L5515_019439 [Caenorhabditis briggsae]|uniref:Uncharacterized protein n=1 Tax=Caenorhabditis briggsae TaxID=6238 RepID=A0AAE9FE90_CAEBR|nr:hypothetical protein L5515_019439 [Caenorhabditis briggsae]
MLKVQSRKAESSLSNNSKALVGAMIGGIKSPNIQNMANNERGESVPDEDHETATIGTLKIMVAAGTDEINKTHKRKFDEITEKLQIFEESVAKILKSNKHEKNDSDLKRCANCKPRTTATRRGTQRIADSVQRSGTLKDY